MSYYRIYYRNISMISMISITIPTADIMVNKPNMNIYGGGFPLKSIDSLWSSAIYEVWKSKNMEEYIYNDLMNKIDMLCENIDFCIEYRLFEEKVSNTLDSERLSIVEGVCILSNMSSEFVNYKLISSLKLLLDLGQNYVVLRNKF
jgi:hypothetical protein